MNLATLSTISKESGLSGDHRGKPKGKGNRQITITSLEQWEEVCRELHVNFPWTTRLVNLCFSGHDFGPEDVGKRITFDGSTLVLEITGECNPCKRMDEIHLGLEDALKPFWRGGATCKVIEPGEIWQGMDVEIT